MSIQNASLPESPEPAGLFLEPSAGTPAATSPVPVVHHLQPEPSSHLCTCGKVREACVHDEIRAFWSAVSGHAQ